MNLEKRVEALETQVAPVDDAARQAEREAGFEASVRVWEELLSTMSEEHAAIVVQDIHAYGLACRVTGQLFVNWQEDCTNLSRRASSMVSWRHNGIDKYDRPFVLPPEVARIYLADPDTQPLHECESCAYEVPFRAGRMRGDGHGGTIPTITPKKYFDNCPLCGGHVGVNAYLYSLQGEIRRCPDCHELRAETAEHSYHLRRHGTKRCLCAGALQYDPFSRTSSPVEPMKGR